MPDLELQLENVTPQLSFAIAEGKVWLNEQRIMLFSQAALGKFRREVFDTIGLDRAKPFFLRLCWILCRECSLRLCWAFFSIRRHKM